MRSQQNITVSKSRYSLLDDEQPVPKKHTSHKTTNKNIKKILCENILNTGKCMYKKTCTYAHKLSEQNVDADRKIILDILQSGKSLKKLDLTKNQHILETLLQFTKMCNKCETNKCAGGYNCKYGAPLKHLVVCKTDLLEGTCKKCDKIHLTKYGMKPYKTSVHKTPEQQKEIDSVVNVLEIIKENSVMEHVVTHGKRSSNIADSTISIKSVMTVMTQQRNFVSMAEKIKELEQYYNIDNNEWINS